MYWTVFLEVLFEGIDGSDVKIPMFGSVVSGDALDGQVASLIGLSGIEGMSANEKFLDAFAIGILDFEVDVKSKATLNVTPLLTIGVPRVGVFEVVFHHLPEFFARDIANGDRRVMGDDVIEVVQSHISGGYGSAESPSIADGEICATDFLTGLEQKIIHC
jgi:hypothetical protein